MISIDYKKLILGLLIGSSVLCGILSEVSYCAAVLPHAYVVVQAENGHQMRLEAQDLQSLRSKVLIHTANLLAASDEERLLAFPPVGNEPFELLTETLRPLEILLLRELDERISLADLEEVALLADYLALDTDNDGRLSEVFRRLAEVNMRVLCQLYENISEYENALVSAQPRQYEVISRYIGTRYLERFIKPYVNLYAELHTFRAEDFNQRHHGPISSIAVSPDGSTVVSGSDDTTLIVWHRNPVTGDWHFFQRLGELNRAHFNFEYPGYITCIALSLDGTTIISGSNNGIVTVWQKDAATGRWSQFQQFAGEHRSVVRAVTLSSDGNTFVTGSNDRTIIVWHKDPTTGQWHRFQQLSQFDNASLGAGQRGGVISLALSGDSNLLVSGSENSLLIVWQQDPATRRWRLRQELGIRTSPVPRFAHDLGVNAVGMLSDDSNVIISVFRASAISAWQRDGVTGNWQRGQQVSDDLDEHTFRRLLDAFMAIALTSDGSTLVSASLDGAVIVWQRNRVTGNWHAVQELASEANSYSARGTCKIGLSADGSTLVRGLLGERIAVFEKDLLTYCRLQRENRQASSSSTVLGLNRLSIA